MIEATVLPMISLATFPNMPSLIYASTYGVAYTKGLAICCYSETRNSEKFFIFYSYEVDLW